MLTSRAGAWRQRFTVGAPDLVGNIPAQVCNQIKTKFSNSYEENNSGSKILKEVVNSAQVIIKNAQCD